MTQPVQNAPRVAKRPLREAEPGAGRTAGREAADDLLVRPGGPH